jgi:ubiquinol-cytochrome c reductase iron-sulfur subunit
VAIAKGRAVSDDGTVPPVPAPDSPACPLPPEGAHPPARPQLPPPGWPVVLGLLITIAGSIGFAVSFILGASGFWIGGCLAAALLGLGGALAFWGRDLAGEEVIAGPYPVPHEDPEGRGALADQLEQDAGVLTRRRFLFRLLIVGGGVFVLSQIVLLGALGPRPRKSLSTTAWTAGARLVTVEGRPVTTKDLAGGGYLVAFPEGHTDAADSQVALFHFVKGDFKPQPGRETWSPEDYVAYSRICTHVGCAVAQYADEAQVLVCPCHQSTFDLLDGAKPLFGPAGRPLPQLPLAIDDQGALYAQSDFTEPVGPGFWNAG